MASITTELVETGTKRDGRGRRIVPSNERAALVEAYRASGLTQRAFSEREGIKFSTFTSWLQGRRRSAAAAEQGGGPLRFVEASVASMLGALEVSLPDGTKVRGANAREVAALVRALRA